MDITPNKIHEIYLNSSPYQVEELMRNYIGQKVCWNLNFYSVSKNEDMLSVGLFSQDGRHYILCKINEANFPLIKILPRETPVRLIGVIESISSILIQIEDAELQEIRDESGQIYFPQGSRESLLAFLEGKLLGAKNIGIYDSYPGKDILKLLEASSNTADIKLLGQNIDATFKENVGAFNIYCNKNVIVKKTNTSHARFYIIDGEVFQVDSSLKNEGGNKATMIHKIDKDAKKITEDFEKWWTEAIPI